MKKYKVIIEVTVDGDATIDEVKDVLAFDFGYSGFCPMPNPFFAEDSGCDYTVENFHIEEL